MNKIYVEFSHKEWSALRGMIKELETIYETFIPNLNDEKNIELTTNRLKTISNMGSHLLVQDLVNMGALTRDDHPVKVMEDYYNKYYKEE